MFTGLEFRIPN